MALEFKDLIIGYKNSRKSQQIAGPFDLKIPEKKNSPLSLEKMGQVKLP